MNVADSDEMLLALSARGYMHTDNLDEADMALINTCTIREIAEHKAISAIGSMAKWKAKKNGRILIVAGCVAQRVGQKLKKRFKYIDIISGAKSIESFASQIDNFGLVKTGGPNYVPRGVAGFVTIMRGCNFNCAYCIVPSVRGPVISLSPDEIKADILRKTAAGAAEIVLLGQTVNAYSHKDMPSFAELLAMVNAMPQVKRIRFTSPHPSFLTDALIEAMALLEKVAPHIHLPLQSGSNRILKLMNRPYTREEVLKKIKNLRSKIPSAAVSTDLIVGFPGETEEDFADTVSLIEEIGTSFAYCFKYSLREGTQSATMKESEVPSAITEERLSRLLEAERRICRDKLSKQKGQKCAILMETENKGRTGENYWVLTKGSHNPGDIVETYIDDLQDTILIARS